MRWALLLATEAGEGGKEPSFTDLNFVTAAWVWVAFIVTFLILRNVAWPGQANTLEEREIRIAEGLRKAEEAAQRARELAEKQEEVLTEARAEAQKLLADARAAAENVKNDLMQSAQQEIGAERERAKKEINLERAKAIDELKQVTIDLTLQASALLLKRELRDEDHKRLAREVVEEVSTRL
jgi:F-type H+-transporting ATPase subunit b